MAAAANLLRHAGDDLKRFFHIINVHGRGLEQYTIDEATACAVNHTTRQRSLNLGIPPRAILVSIVVSLLVQCSFDTYVLMQCFI